LRQFDAYQNPSAEARSLAPYLVVISSHHLRGLSEVIVAPAVKNATRLVCELEIEVEIQGEPLALLISELFSLTATTLRRRACSLAQHEDAIRRALERLFTGF